MNLLKFIRLKLAKPVDIIPLVIFRVALGIAIGLTALLDIIDKKAQFFYSLPTYHFTYWGFSWLEVLPGIGMDLVFYALFILSVFVIIGLWFRVASILLFIIYTYIFLVESVYFLNLPYVFSLLTFLLMFVPAHRAFSIDALRFGRLRCETAPAWSLYIIQFQMAIVYFFASIGKMHPDWISGNVLNEYIMNSESGLYIWLISNVISVSLLSWVVIIFELFIVPLLLWRRTRFIAIIITIVFHTSNILMFNLTGLFPWFMVVATLLFLEPSAIRRWLFRHKYIKKREINSSSCLDSKMVRPAITLLLSVYIVFQLVFPLRHFFYPGDFRWTEEGAKFSWDMYASRKVVVQEPQFLITNTTDGSFESVSFDAYFGPTTLNATKRDFIVEPVLVQQFAHMLAGELYPEGYDHVMVQASIAVSLNGHEPSFLIDPNHNLLEGNPNSFIKRDWIMPYNPKN